MKKMITTFLAVAMLALALAGCSSAAKLDAYVSQMQDAVAEVNETFGDALNVDVAAEGDNTLIITYNVKDDSLGITGEAAQMGTEGEAATFQAAVEAMAKDGITSPVIIVRWVNAAGEELYSQEFK